MALIVSHGQPSDPGPAEAEVAALAARVAAHLPGWSVRAATLAQPGALGHALHGVTGAVRVYPLFMADGWFTQTHLPARLAEAGATDVIQLPPFGLDPAVQSLTVTMALEAAAALGRTPAETEILLAAHGSFKSDAPAAVARAVAALLAHQGKFPPCRTGLHRPGAADCRGCVTDVSGYDLPAVLCGARWARDRRSARGAGRGRLRRDAARSRGARCTRAGADRGGACRDASDRRASRLTRFFKRVAGRCPRFRKRGLDM